jgi:hypothetical protein
MSNNSVETSAWSDKSFSISMGETGGTDTYEAKDGEATEVNLDGTQEAEPEDDTQTSEVVSEDDPGDEDLGDDEAETEEDDEEETPDVDPEVYNEEDKEAFDAKYKGEDGSLNKDILSKEFFDNQAAGKEGLNESTYQYLVTQGIPRDFAKDVEKAMQAQLAMEQQASASEDYALFEVAGGADKLGEALKWGKETGYSKEQQDRFNKVMKGKDKEAKAEAVEALMARYSRRPEAKVEEQRKAKPRVPVRDATKNNVRKPQGIKPFSTRAEYRAARKAAGDNHTLLRQAAQRLAVSNLED